MSPAGKSRLDGLWLRVDEGQRYRQLLKQGLSQQEIARRHGVSQSTVSNRIGLAALPLEVHYLIDSGVLSYAASRALFKLGDDVDTVRRIVQENSADLSEGALTAAVALARSQRGEEPSTWGRGPQERRTFWYRPGRRSVKVTMDQGADLVRLDFEERTVESAERRQLMAGTSTIWATVDSEGRLLSIEIEGGVLG